MIHSKLARMMTSLPIIIHSIWSHLSSVYYFEGKLLNDIPTKIETSPLACTGYLKNIAPVCVAAVEELYIQSSQFLHSCIGQALNKSLRPCMRQSDKWLLIYGREQAK